MKEFLNNKDVDLLQSNDLAPQLEQKQNAEQGQSLDYLQGAKSGDPQAQRALERAGLDPAKVEELEKQDEVAPEEVREILYGGKNVSPADLKAIRNAVLAHPSFAHQARLVDKRGGADAYILFYWSIIQHQKFESPTQVSEFRNMVLQRAKADRIPSAAEWLAQADAKEYSIRELQDYLTGRMATLENGWKQTAIQNDHETEMELALQGEYKSWGRVNAQNQGYFPLVDFVKGNEAVSLKVVDPYDPNTVERLKDHMDLLMQRQPGREIPKENGAEGETDFSAYQIILDLRIPPGTEKKVAELIEYGAALGIEVRISVQGQNPLHEQLRPGKRPPRPGEYIERGPHGQEIENPRKVNMEHGVEILPPTQKADRTWERIAPQKSVRH